MFHSLYKVPAEGSVIVILPFPMIPSNPVPTLPPYLVRYPHLTAGNHPLRVPYFVGDEVKLATPYPNIFFGYRLDAFPLCYKAPLYHHISKYTVTVDRVFFPYLIIEIEKASHSTFVAENQYLNDSAAALRVGGRILSDEENVIYSVAIDTVDARAFVMWKEGHRYLMYEFETLVLQRPRHYRKAPNYVV
ncbi:hypothetical protein F5Y06DRAFT_297553 [Hypoxylon sp. FL0890]|nr:hypothetical protein F5Y06DRAFT_297553 [Hypoxylon sp. FL0890]